MSWQATSWAGSSPRMRGAPVSAFKTAFKLRIIPADARSTPV